MQCDLASEPWFADLQAAYAHPWQTDHGLLAGEVYSVDGLGGIWAARGTIRLHTDELPQCAYILPIRSDGAIFRTGRHEVDARVGNLIEFNCWRLHGLKQPSARSLFVWLALDVHNRIELPAALEQMRALASREPRKTAE